MLDGELGLFARGEASIWTDPHIGEAMLAAHLDLSHDAASRNGKAIDAAVAWIAGQVPRGGRVLDLVCGPGLYAEKLADLGFAVTGIDCNPASIRHAKERTEGRGSGIAYRLGSYLEEPLEGPYDAAIMIYCDYGALVPAERSFLLGRLRESLAPGGLFLFDVFGPGLAEGRKPGKDWSRSEGGFWSPSPHWLLEESKLFPEARAIGTRYFLLEDGKPQAREFVNWDCWFDEGTLRSELAASGFALEAVKRGLVPKNSFASDDVLFARARKERRLEAAAEGGLAIRELVPGDAEALFALLSKPEVREFIPDRFEDLAEMREVVGWLVSNYPKEDFVRLSYKVELGGELIGVVSLGPLPSDESKREISYFFDPAHWGRGYAGAAVAAFLERAAAEGLAEGLHAEVDARNVRSIRVLERSGFVHVGDFADAESGEKKKLYRLGRAWRRTPADTQSGQGR